MDSVTSESLGIKPTDGQFPDDIRLIIGAGHFGKRAATILREKSGSPILIVDKDEDRLAQVRDLAVEKMVCDGVSFLAKNIHALNPSSFIVPAIPIHLASEWLKHSLEANGWKVKPSKIPKEIMPFLPHTWQGKGGTLLISYADFLCPDDCPEPSDHCPMTGETRTDPLHDLLRHLYVPHHQMHIIRSRQLAPGLGGYRVEDLRDLLNKVKQKEGKWWVGTACKCHGALTGLKGGKAED